MCGPVELNMWSKALSAGVLALPILQINPTVFALMGRTRVVILEMRDTMVVHSILPFSRESGGEGE